MGPWRSALLSMLSFPSFHISKVKDKDNKTFPFLFKHYINECANKCNIAQIEKSPMEMTITLCHQVSFMGKRGKILIYMEQVETSQG